MILRRVVGIDLGIKDVIITSDGEKIKNEKVIEKYEKRIKRKQRELARRQDAQKEVEIIIKRKRSYRFYFKN